MRPAGRSWDRVPLRRADRPGRHRAPLRDEPDRWRALGAFVLVWAGAAGAGPESLGWKGGEVGGRTTRLLRAGQAQQRGQERQLHVGYGARRSLTRPGFTKAVAERQTIGGGGCPSSRRSIWSASRPSHGETRQLRLWPRPARPFGGSKAWTSWRRRPSSTGTRSRNTTRTSASSSASNAKPTSYRPIESPPCQQPSSSGRSGGTRERARPPTSSPARPTTWSATRAETTRATPFWRGGSFSSCT